MSEPPAPPPDAPPTPATPEPSGVPPAEEPVAPADLVPQPSRRERLAWYAGAMLLSLALIAVGLRLWDRDFRAPFYYDLDALLYLPLVKTTIETGSHWRTERLGAPGEQALYDFPIIDHLHLAILWGLGRVFSDLLVVYNVYSLLTYPLTVLTAMWVLRWLKLTLPAAAVGGVLYAFLPYHQERYQYHYFLAAYWWVPVSLVPGLAICRGNLPYFRRGADGRYPAVSIDWPAVRAAARGAVRGSRAAWAAALGWAVRASGTALRALSTRRSLGYLALGAVTASAGAYYAFFACAAYSFAGVYGWVTHRTWRAAASAALCVAPVVGIGLAYHIPTFVYQYRYGENPVTRRYPEEAESYGLKIAHLLLPTTDHNVRPLANLRAAYSSTMRPADGENAGSLGFIGGAGLVALLVLAVFPHRRRWPEGALVALTLALVLLTTLGAFGSLFNLLVTPQIRAYNRISVFLAFLSFFAVLWWLDRFLLTRTGRRMRKARYPVLAAVLLFGYFDQTPWSYNPANPRGMEAIDLFAARYRADRDYFRKIEGTMPAGAQVFCLPYSAFPESPAVNKMAAYEHARGYILTDTLRFSFGAIKGREADAWAKDVSFIPIKETERMLKRLVARGFDGLHIDGRGFQVSKSVNLAAFLVHECHTAYAAEVGRGGVRLPEIVHEDGRQFFLDMRPFREAWRDKKPAEYARQHAHETEWVAPLWLGGFSITEPIHEGEWLYWGPFDADLVLVNPTDRTRWFDLSFVIGVEVYGPFDVTIGAPINDRFLLDKVHDPSDPLDLRRHGQFKRYPKVEVGPGQTRIHFRCRPPHYFLPFDRRNLCYYIKEFRMHEVPGP